MNNEVLSVTQVNEIVKAQLSTPLLSNIIVEGEISSFKNHAMGYFFDLKDGNALIKATMWASIARVQSFIPKDGDKVRLHCSIKVYTKGGSYSLDAYKIELAGGGELFKKYQELLAYYERLGYYEQRYKKSIPTYPKRIGIITSATGAVVADFMRTINRRYRLCEVILYPAIVQGPDCPKSVSSQIIKANKEEYVDVLLVGRGGGSFEDLFGFNDPLIIEAIHNSKIPIITCIGHGTDKSISDYVSDIEAPTPTAAAELATPDSNNLIRIINTYKSNIKSNYEYYLDNLFHKLLNINRLINAYSPINRIENALIKKQNLEDKIKMLFTNYLNKKEHQVNNYLTNIESLNPKAILKRGYSIVYSNDKIVKKYSDVNINDEISIVVSDATITSIVKDKEKK